MKIEERIIQNLDTQFEEFIEKHKLHKERIAKAFKWLKEHRYPKDQLFNEEDILATSGNEFLVNNARCVCLRYDFSSAPRFKVELILAPLFSSDDLGEGAGNVKIVLF